MMKRAGFTLVELILVLALLATLLAVSAPSLARSFHGRNLERAGAALLAASEYARSEAVSQGAPMLLWIDAESGSFGVEPDAGYPAANPARAEAWRLAPEVRFEPFQSGTSQNGRAVAATFQPEGTLDAASVEGVRLTHQSGESLTLSKTDDGDGYRLVK